MDTQSTLSQANLHHVIRLYLLNISSTINYVDTEVKIKSNCVIAKLKRHYLGMVYLSSRERQ
jgi:hypothetical protein